MDKKAITLAAALLLHGELAHTGEMFEYAVASEVRLYEPFVFDNRLAANCDHAHTEGPEEMINCSNVIAATGNQPFEVYAITTEDMGFAPTVSMKMLARERLYKTEAEATTRARELQKTEGELSNIQFAVRPYGTG